MTVNIVYLSTENQLGLSQSGLCSTGNMRLFHAMTTRLDRGEAMHPRLFTTVGFNSN